MLRSRTRPYYRLFRAVRRLDRMFDGAHALHRDADDDRRERVRRSAHGHLRHDSRALPAHIRHHPATAAPPVDERALVAERRPLRTAHFPVDRRAGRDYDGLHGALLYRLRRHDERNER